jgi:hypothetical protein
MYHHAKGGRLPKLVYDKMGFPKEVAEWMQGLSVYGKTALYGSI